LHLSSNYVFDIGGVGNAQTYRDRSSSREQWADLQRVGPADACGMIGMIEKQLASLGCPMWPNNGNHDIPAEKEFADVDGTTSLPCIRLWIFGSDGGSD
jgi:hypothetical protein